MQKTIRFGSLSLLALLLGLSARPAEAGLTLEYDFRAAGSDTIIATMTFAAPPASLDTPWSTTDSSTLLSIQLHDPTRGLLEFAPGSLGSLPLTSDGPTLTGGPTWPVVATRSTT